MPGLTGPAAPAHGPHNHTSAPPTRSPTRPPVSPITPTFEPRQVSGAGAGSATSTSNIPEFALGRPLFAHSQPDQIGIAPPPAEPIAFDDNPDVLALKSAISILQLQRARATADMQALRRAKDAALSDPNAFIADLATGKVGTDGDPLMFPSMEEDGSSDEDTEENGDDAVVKTEAPSGNDTSTSQLGGPTTRRHKGKQKGAEASSTRSAREWSRLPKPQSVVRCPPINWAQYGVVGESFDRMHAEQVAAPTPGAPVVLGPGGTYEFKAGDGQASSARRLVGIAAPYTPGKDKVEKKAKKR